MDNNHKIPYEEKESSNHSLGFSLMEYHPLGSQAGDNNPNSKWAPPLLLGASSGFEEMATDKNDQEKLEDSNSILNDLTTTGAGENTTLQDGSHHTDVGIKASSRMANTDLDRVTQYADIFVEVAGKYDLPPAVLAAIASRETRGRNKLDGDGGYGVGIMQVDKTYHSEVAEKILASSSAKEQISLGIQEGAKILAKSLDEIKEKKPDWSPAWQLRGAIAAYNSGVSNVQTQNGLDIGTTGDDYSADVWQRAKFYATIPEFGGATIETAQASADLGLKETNSKSERESGQMYTVLYGESLPKLSRKLGVSVESLKEVNADKIRHWGNVSGFNAGESIKVPIGGKVPEDKEQAAGGWVRRLASAYDQKSKGIRKPDGYESKKGGDETDYDCIANELYKAMFKTGLFNSGVGTDEEAVYLALEHLDKDPIKISKLKKVYQDRFGQDLEQDIRGEFSNTMLWGNELDKALGYLIPKDTRNNKISNATNLSERAKSGYRSQLDNNYENGQFNDGLCNVTSLAMQLLLIEKDEKGLKERVIQKINSNGGSITKEKGQKLQLEDLLAIRIDQKYGKNKDSSGYLPRQYAWILNDIGKESSSQVESSEHIPGPSKNTFLTEVKEAIQGGGSVRVSTGMTGPGHIISLVDVLNDGIIVNDPYGLFVKFGSYILNGSYGHQVTSGVGSETLKLRLKHNQSLHSKVISEKGSLERINALGERNFFSWEEMASNKIGIGKWIDIFYRKNSSS